MKEKRKRKAGGLKFYSPLPLSEQDFRKILKKKTIEKKSVKMCKEEGTKKERKKRKKRKKMTAFCLSHCHKKLPMQL